MKTERIFLHTANSRLLQLAQKSEMIMALILEDSRDSNQDTSMDTHNTVHISSLLHSLLLLELFLFYLYIKKIYKNKEHLIHDL